MNQHLDFSGRTALVCGAETPAGKVIASYLVSRGAKVVLAGDDGTLADGICPPPATSEREHRATLAVCDGRGAAAVDETIGQFGRIDILVGALPRLATVSVVDGGATPANTGAIIDDAAAALAAALPHMRAQDYGRIAWVTGPSGAFPEQGCAGEAICSAAIAALLRTAAIENRAHNLRINLLAATIAGGNGDAALQRVHLANPGHFPAAAIAPLLAWLCHEQCTLDGELMSAGGGRFARIFAATAPGYFNPALPDGAVAKVLEQIISADGYITPRRASDELILTHV